MKKWVLSGSAILNPDDTAEKINIQIENGRITLVSKKEISSSINLTTRGIISTGLINAHDHLLGNYYPKVGTGNYVNWLPWDNEPEKLTPLPGKITD